MIRPGRSGTCEQSYLSCSVHPGPSLLHEFILDIALVSEKVGKIVNFGKQCLAIVGTLESLNHVEDLKQVFTILSLFIPGQKQLRVYMENRTMKYASSSRARHVNACVCTCTDRDEIPHVNVPIDEKMSKKIKYCMLLESKEIQIFFYIF